MDYLFRDPRPEIIQDSGLWCKLFRLCSQLEDKPKAIQLHKHLWTIRSMGTMLKPIDGKLKFVQLIGEGNDWDCEAEFETIKKKYLAPYAAEIGELLKKVMQ